MKLFKSRSKPDPAKQDPDLLNQDDSEGGQLERLGKTRKFLSKGLYGLFKSSKKLDPSTFEEIEDQLLMADMGVDASQAMVEKLRLATAYYRFNDASQLNDTVRRELIERLQKVEQPLSTEIAGRPMVILMVGVNGVGKTTTLAKLASQFKADGKMVMLAACDTFRAAAVEQLQAWGKRLAVPVIAQGHGADAAAVAFDAYTAAKSRNVDILLIDTAGRQHTHGDLMQQLEKILRVLGKVDADIPDEVLLTIDAGNGQNVLSQVEHFNSAIGVTGLCVSKLDGTARGGILVALAERFELPVRYIGIGERVCDLRQFNADEFVQALFPQ